MRIRRDKVLVIERVGLNSQVGTRHRGAAHAGTAGAEMSFQGTHCALG